MACRNFSIYLILIYLQLIPIGIAQATVFKCISEDGGVRYQSTPCESDASEKVLKIDQTTSKKKFHIPKVT